MSNEWCGLLICIMLYDYTFHNNDWNLKINMKRLEEIGSSVFFGEFGNLANFLFEMKKMKKMKLSGIFHHILK